MRYLRQTRTLNFKTLGISFLVSVFPFVIFLKECLLRKHEIDYTFTLKDNEGRRVKKAFR